LPSEVRVASISLSREVGDPKKASEDEIQNMRVTLLLIGREPEVLPKVIRAFYESPYFDYPVPFSEISARDGKPEGTEMNIAVTYQDKGKKP
jgi:hypothetical protein